MRRHVFCKQTSARRVFGFMVLCLMLLARPTGLLAAATTDSEPATTEKVTFDQDVAIEHMKELEQRMYRLAELLREEEPDDSARLMMGVRQARQQLIIEQMKQANDLLDKLDLSNATAEQLRVIHKLESLRKLLLTADLDLEVKLQELRDLRSLQRNLDALIEHETQQREQTRRAEDDENADMADLSDREERNRDSADQLAQNPSASPSASSALTDASGSMGKASEQLSQSQPNPAGEQQEQALEDLDKARSSLSQSEQQLLEELQPLVRDRVIENLGAMLAQEQRVREATEQLASGVAEGQLASGVAEGKRQAELAVRALGPNQVDITDLADSTIMLIEETRFSVTLPVALGAVRDQMPPISDDLSAGRADEELVYAEKQVENDLEDLLNAMKEARRQQKNAGQSGQCQSCGGDKNKLLAEVKLLRLMQLAVNRETGKVNQALAADPSERLGDRIVQLQIRQEQVRNATDVLHAMTCEDCLREAN